MDKFGLDSLGVQEMHTAARALDTDASKYENDRNLEMQWAIKAYHHADTYFKLISTLDSRGLKLTRIDDEIYSKFKQKFPKFKLDILDNEELKSEESKALWRTFCNEFENVVEDFNFGTLIRIDAKKDYSEENTILVTRIQFYAIEIARNREGCNAACYGKPAPNEA
ncbi:Protein PBDC1 [Trichoplax sp. H2]|uniref:Polysaccharide biosynthesis domain-containing protein n=1 Tax=Trichoplax adhaerens TaxID=10228 RepID=B3S3I3_TRIAD|nr:hypothetical protein TRIADDRAFT_58731 [Trichoplax adhaerens]EDV22970.1 hypothetical protein TRIADDRAFT_58731 [Trichoplax adhaerens]RDD42362.1 Protein PBDC1 [Trichoplax sp. H2]|eukprot:XP_002114836.1 hypothetical protein TRIADDRAFT_58731 [Trichoplax adhaerens]